MYRLLGKVLFIAGKPVIRRYLKGTRRSYVLVLDGNSVLLVRNWLSGGGWSLPGGGAHVAETTQTAAARELREEIGIEVNADLLTHFHSGIWSSNRFVYEYHCSYVSVSGASIKKRIFEITDAEFFSMNDIATLPNVSSEIRYSIIKLQMVRTESS